MSKSPNMEDYLNGLTQAMFNRSREDKACVTCGSSKVAREDFADPLSWKEWGISHMCQECQDSTFNKED